MARSSKVDLIGRGWNANEKLKLCLYGVLSAENLSRPV